MYTLCLSTLFLILPRSSTRLSIFFQRPTPKDRTYTRSRDDTACTERNIHRQSHAFDVCVERTALWKIWYSLFFPRLQHSRHRVKPRLEHDRTHGIPCFFNRYTFVSETSTVTNRCITLSFYLSPTRGPCVQFVSLHRDRTQCLSFSLTPPVMFCFSSIHAISSAHELTPMMRVTTRTHQRFSHARRFAHP